MFTNFLESFLRNKIKLENMKIDLISRISRFLKKNVIFWKFMVFLKTFTRKKGKEKQN